MAESQLGRGRLEAFSDGVIAIITAFPAAFLLPVMGEAEG